MEPLEQNDPRRVGPYEVLARLRGTASAVRYLAQGPDGVTAVVSVARPALAELPAFRRRFQAEARTAERLAGGWVPELLDSGDTWTATPYIPGLTLAEAIAAMGPLPERTVRILGAGLAETLSRAHAAGTVLHGLSPESVLLAADGPRLTAFGAVGAAAAAEAGPGGGLSVRLGYLTPEQITGDEPGTASDVFVLGLLLAYASTGTTPLTDAVSIATADPELTSVPDSLRPLVAECLSKPPSARPTAGQVAAGLALEGAACLARAGWLPEPLLESIAAKGRAAGALTDESVPEASRAARGVSGAATAGGVTRSEPVDAAASGERSTPATASTAAGSAMAPQDDAAHVAAPAAANAGKPTPGLPAPADPPTGSGPTDAAPSGDTSARTAASAAEPTGIGADADTPGSPSAGPQDGANPGAPSGPSGGTLALRGEVAPDAPVSADTLALARPVPRGDRATTQLVVPQVPALPPASAASAGPAGPAGPEGDARPASRRALLAGILGGVVGVALGAGGVAVAGAGRGGAPDAKPATPPRKVAVAGVPPEAVWAYESTVTPEGRLEAVVWQDRILVLTSDTQATAVDLRTGRRLWQSAAAASAARAMPGGPDLLFVVGKDAFLWVSPKDGSVRHRAAPGLVVSAVTGQEGPVVWLTGTLAAQTYLVAYDVVRRKELWRTNVPNGRPPRVPAYRLIAVRADGVVVQQDPASLTVAQQAAAKGLAVFHSYDRVTGKIQWSGPYAGVLPGAPAVGDATGRLFASVGNDLQAFHPSSRTLLWRQPALGPGGFGTGLPHADTLYAATRSQTVYALDPATGKPRWQRPTEATAAAATAHAPQVTLSGSTLLVADGAQVTAFGAGDGRRLWKFQTAGTQDPRGKEITAPYRTLAAGRTVVVRRDRAFYALPLA